MDQHPHRPDELSELERRLSAWAPADAGLNADAVLFAAGRASARPGLSRFVWPALTTCMTLLALVLGVCLIAERSERLDLARQLRPQPSVPAPPAPSLDVDRVERPSPDEPPPDSYLASHRALEKGLDAWPIQAVVRVETSGPLRPSPAVLQAGHRDVLLDP